MTVADTTVLVAAFADWHEHHDLALRALDRVDAVVAHVAIESTSTLTRMPEPFRAEPAIVTSFLQQLPSRWIALSGPEIRRASRSWTDAGLSGGALYDALIATTAALRSHRLLTLDRRAEPIYRAVGADVEFL